MVISEETKKYLCFLADKYETSDFLKNDPSFILHRYGNQADIEISALIAALLAFGQRKQFLPKIKTIAEIADSHGMPAQWIKNSTYRTTFPPESNTDTLKKKFYRFYSYNDFLDLFDVLKEILQNNETLSSFFKERYLESCRSSGKNKLPLAEIICSAFKSCKMVPQGKNSANKRINMFLRWMVRRNSQVDLGLWDWYAPADLIIPLDTHVMQEAVKLNLLPEKCTNSVKTAIMLTESLRQVWPDDPCKGDFALFGLGTDIQNAIKGEPLKDLPY